MSEWNNEYQLFLDDSLKNSPPSKITSLVKENMNRELNPSSWIVFLKLFAIHFISGTATIFICPQFGIEYHSKIKVIFRAFLMFGEYGCMIACGAFFLGATAVFAALLLKPQEVHAIKKSKGLQWAFLSFVSAGFFLSFQEQEMSIPGGLVVAWFIGALVGGTSFFRLSYLIRSKLRQQFVF